MSWTISSKSGVLADVSENNRTLQTAEGLVGDAKSSITNFSGDSSLKGGGYDSAKAYFETCHGVILDALSLLIEDAQAANSQVLSSFDSSVSEPMGLEAVKAELEKAIADLEAENEQLRQEIADAEASAEDILDDISVAFIRMHNNWLIEQNNKTIEKFKNAISQVDAYAANGGQAFGDIEAFISHITSAIRQLSGSFSAANGTFTIQNNFAGDLINFLHNSCVSQDGTVDESRLRMIYDQEGKNFSALELMVLNQFLPKPIPLNELTVDKFARELKSQIGKANYHSLTLEQRSFYVFDYEYFDDSQKKELDRILGPAKDGTTIDRSDDQNIRFFIYTADNDYGKVFRQNLDKIQVETWNSSGTQFYSPSTGRVSLNVNDLRSSATGPYTTFFHEVAHLYDDKLGDLRNRTNRAGVSLHDAISADARAVVLQEINNHPQGNKLTDAEKDDILSHIFDPTYDAIESDDPNKGLTRSVMSNPRLELIRNQVASSVRSQLKGGHNEAVSDVYGGLSGNELRGGWGHSGKYWYEHSNGNRKSPGGEFFAEHFSYNMTGDQLNGYTEVQGKFIPSSQNGLHPDSDSQLEQNRRYLSGSSNWVDEVIREQVK